LFINLEIQDGCSEVMRYFVKRKKERKKERKKTRKILFPLFRAGTVSSSRALFEFEPAQISFKSG